MRSGVAIRSALSRHWKKKYSFLPRSCFGSKFILPSSFQCHIPTGVFPWAVSIVVVRFQSFKKETLVRNTFLKNKGRISNYYYSFHIKYPWQIPAHSALPGLSRTVQPARLTHYTRARQKGASRSGTGQRGHRWGRSHTGSDLQYPWTRLSGSPQRGTPSSTLHSGIPKYGFQVGIYGRAFLLPGQRQVTSQGSLLLFQWNGAGKATFPQRRSMNKVFLIADVSKE